MMKIDWGLETNYRGQEYSFFLFVFYSLRFLLSFSSQKKGDTRVLEEAFPKFGEEDMTSPKVNFSRHRGLLNSQFKEVFVLRCRK